MWGSFRDHGAGKGFTMTRILNSLVVVPQWVPEFQWESKVPFCLPALSFISIFVDNKSICTGSGMSP